MKQLCVIFLSGKQRIISFSRCFTETFSSLYCCFGLQRLLWFTLTTIFFHNIFAQNKRRSWHQKMKTHRTAVCDSNKLYWLCVQMSKGMQIQASESEIVFVFFLSLVLFSYKTTCTLSNQFCSVQTTKIPVLHYQILHIENIYKAQV